MSLPAFQSYAELLSAAEQLRAENARLRAGVRAVIEGEEPVCGHAGNMCVHTREFLMKLLEGGS